MMNNFRKFALNFTEQSNTLGKGRGNSDSDRQERREERREERDQFDINGGDSGTPPEME